MIPIVPASIRQNREKVLDPSVGNVSFPMPSDQFWSIQLNPLVHWGGVRLTLGA